MCNKFECKLSKKCISEFICADVRCPYFLNSDCSVCVIANVCKEKKNITKKKGTKK